MIEIKDIKVTFNKANENEVIALDNIHINFYSNEWVFVIGGNGSGKSTLLQLLNRELIPDKGSVLMNGITKKDILFVDQSTLKNLVPSMSVYENLILGFQQNRLLDYLKFYSEKHYKEKIAKTLQSLNLWLEKKQKEQVRYLSIVEQLEIISVKILLSLSEVLSKDKLSSSLDLKNNYKEKIIRVLKAFNKGLENRLNEQVRFLSGGEQQIIIAARILLSNSKLILMDEFTSSLDQKLAPVILDKLKKYVIENSITVIAVTHDFSQIKDIGDRILMLKDGKLIEDKDKSTFDFSTQSILKLFYDK